MIPLFSSRTWKSSAPAHSRGCSNHRTSGGSSIACQVGSDTSTCRRSSRPGSEAWSRRAGGAFLGSHSTIPGQSETIPRTARTIIANDRSRLPAWPDNRPRMLVFRPQFDQHGGRPLPNSARACWETRAVIIETRVVQSEHNRHSPLSNSNKTNCSPCSPVAVSIPICRFCVRRRHLVSV